MKHDSRGSINGATENLNKKVKPDEEVPFIEIFTEASKKDDPKLTFDHNKSVKVARYIPDDEITRVSHFTDNRVCWRFGIALFVVMYFLAVAAGLYFFTDDNFTWAYTPGDLTSLYLLFLPGINLLLILWIGRYILSAILYPY